MADIAIFRINYKSDFILTLQSDAGWLTPFCIKFWTGEPSQAYFAGYDGTTYTHCAPVDGDPTKLSVQFDDHHLPIGDLKFQIGYHFTVADFPTSIEDEVINQAAVIIDNDGEQQQVMLDFNGETAPDIAFSLPAYANEAQRIANEQVRIAAEEQRVSNEQQRISNEEGRISAEERRQEHEQQRIHNEEIRIAEFARLEADAIAATGAANDAATLANEKAQLATDKAALAQSAATLANDKAQLAADKAALAQAAATLANDKAALAQQKADYAQAQGDYAKAQSDIALADHERAETDHERAEADHDTATDDHTTATSDHTQAESDHTRAEADHTTAASDHTQASSDHDRAESDHTKAGQDHDRAESDHTTAAADHTRAESDHAAVEVYVDSLGAFDISAYHATGSVLAKYADLTAALGTNGANIPDELRKGGMSVKFVLSSDNKYVQYRLMSDTFNTTPANWQGVDEEPIAGSENLVKSGGVLNSEALLMSSVFVKPFVTNHSRIDKNTGKKQSISSLTTRATGWIAISENSDVFVFGTTGSVSTAVALYSSKSEDDFIIAEQNDSFVHYTAEELLSLGAKYIRCTITEEQFNTGTWFVTASNVEESLITEKEIDLSVYPLSRWSINANNLWVSNTLPAQVTRTKFVPIEPGKTYMVRTVITSIVAILKDDEDKVKGTTPHFSDDFSERISVEANGSFSFVCPSDAHIFYLLHVSSAGQTETTISETQTIQDLYKRVSDVEDKIEDIDVESGDANIVDLRRFAEIKGNSLTPLSIPVDENGYEIPTTREVLNVQKKSKQMTDIVWTPLADIPYHGTGGVFPANVPVTGLPYSSVKEIDKYIGFDVSIHTFMTALNNPYSLLYTECVLGTRSASAWGKTYHGVDGVACYMGTVCSVLSGYGTGQVVQWPTAEDSWCAERNLNMIKVFNQSAQGLHIGDIIWISGHNRLVVGLKRDSDGNVTHVQITESTGSHVRQNNDITAVTFDNNLATERGGGIIYRNTELYKNTYTPSEFVAVGDETITPYVYNDDICTFAGNKACFRENDLIVINYDLKNSNTAWTAIEVYKDDVLLETYNIADIDQSELPEGQRNHALKLGSEHTYGMYKARLTDGTNYSDYTYWEVIQTDVTFVKNDSIHHIKWGSENGVPLSFTICNINGTVYAHNELAIEDVRNGYLDLDLVKFNKQQYPSKAFTANMYLKIHFEGQYGRVTNEPFIIEI